MSQLSGHQISKSDQIQKLIDGLVKETTRINSTVKTVRPPLAEFEKSAHSLYDRIGRARGRPLYYPYVGTGAGHGPYVELEDGSVKLDLINGIGVHLFGHGHPNLIAAALRGALSDIVMQGHLEMNSEYLRLSEKVLELAGQKSRIKHCWISTCGTMSNENALKIARQKNSPARKILAFHNNFAGRSTLMAELTDNPEYKMGLPEYHEVLRLPFLDPKNPSLSTDKTLATLKRHLDENKGNICAISFEPMMGEGGFYWGGRSFYAPIFDLCKSHGIAIWADEVQTFARTGQAFAFETLDIGDYIDICTIAKTVKVGATLYTEEYNPKPGLISGTFAGSSSALACGYEVLRMLTDDGYLGKNGKIAKIHQDFVAMLNDLNATTCKGLIKDAGGLGLMVAMTPLGGDKDKVNKLLKIMYKNGIISYSAGRDPYRVRFLIPAVMSTEDIAVTRSILERSILEVEGA